MVKLLVECAAVAVGIAGIALISVPAAMIVGGIVGVVAVERHS